MTILILAREYAYETAAMLTLSWIVFLIAIRMITALFADGGLIPPAKPPLSSPPPVLEEHGPSKLDDCIVVADMKVCGADESEGPLWR